jgi:hypothetical protein
MNNFVPICNANDFGDWQSFNIEIHYVMPLFEEVGMGLEFGDLNLS